MLFRHVLLYLPVRVLPGLVNFATVAIFTRALSPTAYGRYAYVIALVTLFQAVVFQWLRLGIQRWYQPCQGQGQLLALRATVAVGFSVSTVIAGLAWIGLILWQPALKSHLLVGIFLLFAQALFELQLEVQRANLNPKRYGLLVAVRTAWGFISSIGLLVVGNLGEYALLVGPLFGVLAALLFDFESLRGSFSLRLFDRELMMQLLGYGLPLTATYGFAFVISTSDRFFLEHFHGSASLGLYSVGYDLAQQTLTLLFMVIHLAAYPLALRAWERGGRIAVKEQLYQNGILFFGMAIPTSVGFAYVSPNIMRLMLGQAFQGVAIDMMPWIALSTFLAGTKAYFFDLPFHLERRTVPQLWSVIAGALTNLVLNFALVPKLGVMGAAYSTLISYAVALCVGWYLTTRIFPMPLPTTDIGKFSAATMGMLVVLTMLRSTFPFRQSVWYLLFEIVVGALTYGVIVWIVDAGCFRSKLTAILTNATEG